MRSTQGALLLLAAGGPLAEGASPPHLVFVLGDDVGFGDVGYVDSAVLTPHLDVLARNGVRLGRQYSYAWCAASRSALLSGRYPVYTGVYGGASGPNFALGEEFELLPSLLRKSGYRTHAVGKWHLGMYDERFLPEQRGFDSFFGFLNGGEDHFEHSSTTPACTNFKYTDLWDSTLPGPATNDSYFPRYSSELYGEKAVDIVRNHDPLEPLFLYVAFQNAHSPLQVPQKYFDRYPEAAGECPWSSYKDKAGFLCTRDATDTGSAGKLCRCNRVVISAMVSALDDAVGALKLALQDKGMWKNTVFVFSGDNGGPQGEAHWNAGLRGGKWTNFEGGLRPAAFVHAEMLPVRARGTWNNNSMHLVDWLPTFLNLAGSPALAGSLALDGIDQWPAIAGGASDLRNYTLATRGILIAGQYKLITVPPMGDVGGFDGPASAKKEWQGWECLLGTGGGWMELPNSNQNLCPNVDCSTVTAEVDKWLCAGACNITHPCLFDVVADRGERVNLAASKPDIVSELMGILQAFDERIAPSYKKKEDVNKTMCSTFKERWGGYMGPWYNAASGVSHADLVV